MGEEDMEKLKDLKAVYSGAIQSGEIGIANMIKGGIDLIEKLQKENQDITQQRDYYKARYNALSKIVDLMAKHIYSLGYYDCLYEECDDNMDRECEDCIKEYFYKKVKETKDNGSTRNI